MSVGGQYMQVTENGVPEGKKFVLVGYSLANWGGDKALASGNLVASDGVEIPAEMLNTQLTRILTNEDKRFIWNTHKTLERLWEEKYQCFRRGSGRSYLVTVDKWPELKAETEKVIAKWRDAVDRLMARYGEIVNKALVNLDDKTHQILSARLPSVTVINSQFKFKLDTPLPFQALPGEEVSFEQDAKFVLFERIQKEATSQLKSAKEGCKASGLIKRLHGLRDLIFNGTVLYDGAYKFVELLDKAISALPKEGVVPSKDLSTVHILLGALQQPSTMMSEQTWEQMNSSTQQENEPVTISDNPTGTIQVPESEKTTAQAVTSDTLDRNIPSDEPVTVKDDFISFF